MRDVDVGTILGQRFRLRRCIGEGGYGAVWEADDIAANARVAVKLLKVFTPDAIRRFDIEGDALARLEHPHCVRIIARGADHGRHFIVTDFIDGPSLRAWSETGPSIDQRIEVIRQVASALVHAHRSGVFHRDLKPENVLITQQGRSAFAHVVDFGLAKLTGLERQDVTKTGEVFGTPGYMSPEQLRGQDPSAATDVYALGVVLYELIQGTPPFEGGSMLETAMQHLTATAPRLTMPAPPHIVSLIGRMLTKEPEARPTMANVVRMLRGQPEEQPPVLHEAPRRSAARSGMVAAALVAVVALAGIVFVVFDSDAPAKQTVATVPRNVDALTEPQERAPEVVSTADVGVDLAPEDAGEPWELPPSLPAAAQRTSGCGVPAPKDTEVMRDTGPERSTIHFRLPPNYRPDVPAPLLIVFHDVMFGALEVLKNDSMLNPAHERGFVIVSISDNRFKETWLDEADYDGAVADIDFLSTFLCLDRRRTFLFGHGNGGYGAIEVACRMPGVRAMATFAHRMWPDRQLCTRARPVPTLTMTPLHDPFAPAEGGEGCMGSTFSLSLEEHARIYRKSHGCEGPSEQVHDVEGATCWSARCEVPVQWCHTDGGRYWRGMSRSFLELLEPCKSPVSAIDPRERVWTFFDEHDLD